MKSIFRRSFEPAIRFLNRYSFSRKFAIAGTLVVLPLVFVTCQYMAHLNEQVEVSQQELAGNQAIRLLIPLWRTLRDTRLESAVATRQGQPRTEAVVAELRVRLLRQLEEIDASDLHRLHVLMHSSRWASFRAKVRMMASTEAIDRPNVSEPELLDELIEDLRTVLRDIADLSKLSACKPFQGPVRTHHSKV